MIVTREILIVKHYGNGSNGFESGELEKRLLLPTGIGTDKLPSVLVKP